MKYQYLSQQERDQAKDRRRIDLQQQLRDLEAQHFERELDWRHASKLTPPDETAMATARAEQAKLDADYQAVLDAATAGG